MRCVTAERNNEMIVERVKQTGLSGKFLRRRADEEQMEDGEGERGGKKRSTVRRREKMCAMGVRWSGGLRIYFFGECNQELLS